MRSACALVRVSAVVRKAVGSYRYVLVDVGRQDLNGPRQEFIRSVDLCRRRVHGFVDPNQAIYDDSSFRGCAPG